MEKVAHSLFGLPPSVSLNTSGNFGGMPEASARNHRNFLYGANIQQFFNCQYVFEKNLILFVQNNKK